MKRLTTLLLLLLTMAVSGHAQVTLKGRFGDNIGGTTPLGMPATLRQINRFYPTVSPLLGLDAEYPLTDKWGLMAGLYYENKGLNAHVTTKYYHMLLQMDGNELEGEYSGRVKLDVDMWMFTVPLNATWHVAPRWSLRAGPYVSLLVSRKFEGYVYDGYLRKDDPTGPKVEMGHGEGSRGTFNFPDDMRRVHYGLNVGADYQLASRVSLYGDLKWGLNGIFKSSFKTVEQTLYPIYLNLGVAYTIL